MSAYVCFQIQLSMNRFLLGLACLAFLLLVLLAGEKQVIFPPNSVKNVVVRQVVPPPDSIQKQELSEPISPPEPDKFLYFTIDDGPSKFSDDILETAQTMQIPLTVFLVGGNLWGREYPIFIENYRREPLIELANHSFCHAKNDYDNWYLNPTAVAVDFQKNQALFEFENRFARLPGRSIWEVGKRNRNIFPNGGSSAALLRKMGWTVFGWDVEWKFFHKTGAPKGTAESVVAAIEKRVADGLLFTENHVVLLLHERHFQQKTEVEKLIRLLKNDGWIFRHLKNYPLKSAVDA